MQYLSGDGAPVVCPADIIVEVGLVKKMFIVAYPTPRYIAISK
jgi:hypothetical protein